MQKAIWQSAVHHKHCLVNWWRVVTNSGSAPSASCLPLNWFAFYFPSKTTATQDGLQSINASSCLLIHPQLFISAAFILDQTTALCPNRWDNLIKGKDRKIGIHHLRVVAIVAKGSALILHRGHTRDILKELLQFDSELAQDNFVDPLRLFSTTKPSKTELTSPSIDRFAWSLLLTPRCKCIIWPVRSAFWRKKWAVFVLELNLRSSCH